MANGLLHRVSRGMRAARVWLLDNAYLVTLGAMVAVIAATAMYTRALESREQAGIQAAAPAPEVAQTATPSPTPTPRPTATPTPTHAAQAPAFAGEVLRGFTPGAPVYWQALGVYQPHAALDIAGAADEVVRCLREGVVTQTVRDELWGWRVRVEQADGFTAEYAGLASCAVAAGAQVTRGDALGTLLPAIPCEAELPAHLHLSMTRSGEAVDPAGALSR